MLNWTGTRGLYTRLGHIAKVLSDVNTFQGTTLPTDVGNILTQYTSGSADEALIDGIAPQLVSAQNSAGNIMSFLQQVATNTVNTQVYLDTPLSQNSNIQLSLQQVYTDMILSGQTLLKQTVGATSVATAGNLGNGVVVLTTYRSDGRQQENLLAERIGVNCITDSTSNSSLAGQETFSVLGALAENNPFASDWPLGSACSQQIAAVNASVYNTTNLLTNGDFATWTGTAPNNWSITSGSSSITSGTTTYKENYSLQITGDGSTLSSLQQTFGISSGSTSTLNNESLYTFNCWIRTTQISPQTGVLSFDLVDGNNNITLDVQGANNTVSQTLSALTSANVWYPFNGTFRTPYIMPSAIHLRARLSTAMTSGTLLYIDEVSMTSPTQLYSYGPSMSVFSGSTNFYAGDSFVVTTTNSRGTSGTLNTFQTCLERLFGMTSQYNILMPSATSGNTINDNLIS